MNNQNLIIYDFEILFNILKEIEEHLNFKLLHLSKEEYSKFKFDKFANFIVISKKNININNQILFTKYPLSLVKLIEIINIRFLKNKFIQQSEFDLGLYKINLNSRNIFNEESKLSLTEKECDIIIFLKNSNKPVKINELQLEVWGHNLKLETHTVETHIYRLRKKISETFKNDNFIISSKLGYIIK
tara:strand:+ start:5508 stop:6068 length:561 start_codon:yes stop_codon:yes gene_type:complete